MPTAAETKFWTASPAIWLRYDIVVLAGVVLPVRVGDEARRRVERDVGEHRRSAVRVERQVALQAQEQVEQRPRRALKTSAVARRPSSPAPLGAGPEEAVERTLDGGEPRAARGSARSRPAPCTRRADSRARRARRGRRRSGRCRCRSQALTPEEGVDEVGEDGQRDDEPEEIPGRHQTRSSAAISPKCQHEAANCDQDPHQLDHETSVGSSRVKPALRARGASPKGFSRRRCDEPVAGSGLGQEVARLVGVGLELLSQLRDVDVQVTRFHLVRRPPDLAQERLVRQQLALVLRE